MTRDPGEGVDAAGYLVTGAAPGRVPAAYAPVVADCVATLVAAYGDRLDGLYLYGSVATGQARPPQSDLDLLAVRTSPADGVPAAVAALTARHRALVREVGLAEATPADLDGEADRCFLKHYCVPLAGRDRRPELPRCRPSRALADGFNSDLGLFVARFRSTLDADPAGTAHRAARRLLLAVAVVESVSHATWSTDRGTGATLLATHHPEWADVAEQAAAWASAVPPTADPATVRRLLELTAFLDRHPQ